MSLLITDHTIAQPRHTQSGAVLIIVLIMLLLISVLGIIAYKRSTTDLRLATASQIAQLMFQANDSAFAKVEKEDRLNTETKGNVDTLQGFITRPGPQYVGAEVVFCVRPRATALFRLDKVTQKNQQGNVINGTDKGFCNPADANDYVNEGRVITQMTFIKLPNTLGDCPLCGHAKNDSSNDIATSSGADEPQCTYFTGYAVSLVPSYAAKNVDLGDSSSTDTSTVAGCLKQPMTKITSTTVTVDKCLADLGVPHNIQMQNYKHEPVGVSCLQ